MEQVHATHDNDAAETSRCRFCGSDRPGSEHSAAGLPECAATRLAALEDALAHLLTCDWCGEGAPCERWEPIKALVPAAKLRAAMPHFGPPEDAP